MGRREKPVCRKVPESAKLANYLRSIRELAGLTYPELAGRASSSAATLKRAASGNCVPKRAVIEDFAAACAANDSEKESMVATAIRLWRRARYAERRPGSAYQTPCPQYIGEFRDMSVALRDLHAWAGFPSSHDMERRAGGFGLLPHSTAHRVTTARTVPNSPEQLIAYLVACEEPSDRHKLWRDAYRACAKELPPATDPDGSTEATVLPIRPLPGEAREESKLA